MISESKALDYVEWLNKNCPLEYEWVWDKPVFKITVPMECQETITSWVRKIVGCSHYYDADGDELIVLFTYSTLENCFNDETKHVFLFSDNDIEPIKMNRFSKVTNDKSYMARDMSVSIVDNSLLLDVYKDPYDYAAVIFTASSSSMYANHLIVDTVLELLNSDQGLVDMMDTSRKLKEASD